MNIKTLKWLMVAALFFTGVKLGHAQAALQLQVTNAQELAASRAMIDSLDSRLIQILGERERVVKAIGIYKAKNHIALLQAARFKQVVDKGIAAGNKEGLSPGFITELLNAIHKESLRIESDSTVMKR